MQNSINEQTLERMKQQDIQKQFIIEKLKTLNGQNLNLEKEIKENQDIKQVLIAQLKDQSQVQEYLIRQQQLIRNDLVSSSKYSQSMISEYNSMVYIQNIVEDLVKQKIPSLKLQYLIMSSMVQKEADLIQQLYKQNDILVKEIQVQFENKKDKDIGSGEKKIKLRSCLEQLLSKLFELDSVIQYKQTQYEQYQLEHNSEVLSIQNQLNSLREEQKQLFQRQEELRAFKDKVTQQIKPQLEEQNQNIKILDDQITQYKRQINRFQKSISSSASSPQQSPKYLSMINSYRTFTKDLESTVNFQSLKVSECQTLLSPETITTKDFEIENQQKEKSLEQQSLQESPSKKQFESLVSDIHYKSISNDSMLREKYRQLSEQEREIISKLFPLFKGIEVYRKVFDTKFMSLSQQQRFNIFHSNKQKTPDLEGYALRVVQIAKGQMKNLQIRNPHEQNRVEQIIDIKRDKINTPKETKDSVKYQKEDCHPMTQSLKNSFADQKDQGIAKNQQKTFNRSHYKENEKDTYIKKCKQAQFYRIVIIQADREIDILVPNAGGFYNYTYFSSAIETLCKLDQMQVLKFNHLFK